MPTLEQVGINRPLYAPYDDAPLMSASDVRGPFYIVNAYTVTTRNGMNPGPRIVMTLKCRDAQSGGSMSGSFSEDDDINAVKVMLSPDESRSEAAEYFKAGNRAAIGPCGFLSIPTRSGNNYQALRTWTPELEQQIMAALTHTSSYTDAIDAEDELEDLPF